MENAWKCYLNLNPNFILFYIIKNTLKLWGWFQLYLKLIKKKKNTYHIPIFNYLCNRLFFSSNLNFQNLLLILFIYCICLDLFMKTTFWNWKKKKKSLIYKQKRIWQEKFPNFDSLLKLGYECNNGSNSNLTLTFDAKCRGFFNQIDWICSSKICAWPSPQGFFARSPELWCSLRLHLLTSSIPPDSVCFMLSLLSKLPSIVFWFLPFVWLLYCSQF